MQNFSIQNNDSKNNNEICENILVELRKIVRSMSIHSRRLQREYALTGPQLVVLREVTRAETIAIGSLAKRVSLSNATVTGIVDRLEQCGLVRRERNGKDRRQIFITGTEQGKTIVQKSPPLFQEHFLTALSGLGNQDQAEVLSVVSRLAGMMGNSGEVINESIPLPALSEPDGFIASCQMLLDTSEPGTQNPSPDDSEIRLVVVRSKTELPERMDRETLAAFLHEYLRPYEDTREDILEGLNYALDNAGGRGGFVLLAMRENSLAGALVMLNTGMKGYVPEHLLLFVAVHSDRRGQGIGAAMIKKARQLCTGNIKLHVEYDNPAKRLYERLGFSSKYAEMRWENESCNH